jgi:hypothetical protein
MTSRRLRLRLNPFEKKRTAHVRNLRNRKALVQRRKAKLNRISKAKKGVAKSKAHNANPKAGAKKVAAKKK